MPRRSGGIRRRSRAGASGEVRRDAWFNLANTLFRAGAFPEAAAAFGEAIALDPEDLEARQNLERALRAAEEQDQQDQQQQEQDQQDQQQEEQDRQEQGQDQQGQDGQDRQNPPQQGEEDERDRESGEAPPPEGSPQPADRPPADDTSGSAPEDAGPGADNPESVPGEVPEISPEQAERILAALADIERAFQEERLQQRRARALRRGRH